MTTSIAVRNVPKEVRDELAARAQRSGRSLQEFLRLELIELANEVDMQALLKRINNRKQREGSSLSVDKIIEHRDAGRQ